RYDGDGNQERLMLRAAMRTWATAAVLLAGIAACRAEDALKIAIGQRGGWERCGSRLGQNAGFFQPQDLTREGLYTHRSAVTLQSVNPGSVDIGTGVGTHALIGAFAKGAPVRAIGASFTSADDQFYYVPADSPLHSMKEADGRTIATSPTGSASHIFALAL